MANILFSCDDNYAPHVGVLIISILRNTRSPKSFNFFIIDNAISEDNRQKIENIAGQSAAEVTFIPCVSEGFEEAAKARYGLAACQRIDMANLLPADLERVIYLDADMIVLGDLAELWHTGLEGNTVGAVENLSPKPCKVLGWKRQDYFNSGLLVVDLVRWRKENIKERCVNYLEEHAERSRFPDQDALNEVFRKNWKKLPLKWNVQADIHGVLKKYSQGCGYSRVELGKAMASPSLIHFIGRQKPWLVDCHNAYKSFYTCYKKQSPWSANPPADATFYSKLKYYMSLKKLLRQYLRYQDLSVRVSDLP